MQIRYNASLLHHNTFGLEATAEAMVTVYNEAEVAQLLQDERLPRPFRVLGGGSNILLSGPVSGTVVRNAILGEQIVSEGEEEVLLQVGGGTNWHQFVLRTLELGLAGAENLALIPGTVGAAPIQNIGAYGVEVKDILHSVHFMLWDGGGEVLILDKEACNFGYRDSIFKGELKGAGLVTAVVFKLSKKAKLRTDYGAIKAELERLKIENPTPAHIAEVVAGIRRSKLPDPAVTGNAGSFFKNPTIPKSDFTDLQSRFPDLPHWPAGEDRVKVPAGWLIEHCGWKGHVAGAAGVHPLQALVLINRGGATGAEIKALSSTIIASVQERFGIALEREVQEW